MFTPSSSRRAAAALLVLALAGCPRRREDPESYAARNAVIRYNQGLVEAFRASRGDLLGGVASSDEISRVVAVISGLATRGQYMVATQVTFDVVEIKVDPTTDGGLSTARVEARESWRYEHRSLAAHDAPAPPKALDYHLRYKLKREGAGWLVDEVEDLGAPAGNPK